MTFAIIETGGKQYKVTVGQKLNIEKILVAEGGDFALDKVLLVSDGDQVKIGAPYVSGAEVGAKVLKHDREDKKIVFKYHAKTRYRKKKGHRQPFTQIEITNIK